MTTADKMQALQQALIDYVIMKSADDAAVEYTVSDDARVNFANVYNTSAR